MDDSRTLIVAFAVFIICAINKNDNLPVHDDVRENIFIAMCHTVIIGKRGLEGWGRVYDLYTRRMKELQVRVFNVNIKYTCVVVESAVYLYHA